MRLPRWLWILLAAAHLVLVICGASDCLPARKRGPLAQGVRWYASMSGANSGYGFYAPNVGPRYRTNFLLQNDQGMTWCDSFEQADSPEARLRLGGIVTAAFANGEADGAPDQRGRLVKSWAATMFTRHPNAQSLAVVVEAYDVPTMAEYRAGQRPGWKVVYEARVQKNSATVAAGPESAAAPGSRPVAAQERSAP